LSAFGSPEWFAEASAAAGSVGQAGAACLDAVVQYTVKGAPQGILRCHAVVADGKVTVLAEGMAAADPDIAVTIDFDTAHDIVSGVHSAEAAFMNGALRLEGRHALWLADLHDLRAAVLEALAAITD